MIDANESVDNTRAIMGDLLAVHDLTDCDTVATYHGHRQFSDPEHYPSPRLAT